MVRRVLQDNKVSGSSTTTKVAAAPGPVPAGSATGFLGESWVNGSLPCQTRFEQHLKRPGCLKLQGDNKDEMVNTQGLCAPTETLDTVWEELGHDRPWSRLSPVWLENWTGWEARPLYGAAGLSRRNFSKGKREKRGTQQLFGEFSCSSHPGLCTPNPAQLWGTPTVVPKALCSCPKPWGECAPEPAGRVAAHPAPVVEAECSSPQSAPDPVT